MREKRQPCVRMQSRADQAGLAGAIAQIIRVLPDDPGRRAEPGRFSDDPPLVFSPGSAEQPDDEDPGLTDRDRSVPEFEGFIRVRRNLTRLRQLQAPLGREPEVGPTAEDDDPTPRRQAEASAGSCCRHGLGPEGRRSIEIGGESGLRSERRKHPEQEREHARERAGHDDRAFVAGRRDQGEVRGSRQGALGSARDGDRGVSALPHLPNNGYSLRGCAGPGDDDHGDHRGRDVEHHSAGSKEHLGKRRSRDQTAGHLAPDGRGRTGEVVRRPGPGDDHLRGFSEEVPHGSAGTAGRFQGSPDRLPGRRGLVPRQEPIERRGFECQRLGHRS